ncbi:MAG: TRAP transporter small permease [Defluviicoccus sp.]|nr:TRAP transporter small permease [Defluviicoccus sp.]
MADDGARAALPVRRLLGWMVAVALAFMMVLTAVDVTGRFAFDSPIPGSFEVMEFCLAIVVFSALPLVTWDRRHITVSLFDSLFRGAGYRVQQCLVQGASLLAMGIVCWRMWDQGERLERTQAITGYLEWPVAPIAYFMSVLAGLSTLLILMLLWRALAGRPYPVYEDGGGIES